MIQGGDIIHNNGSSGESIYGGTFEDENLDLTLIEIENCGEFKPGEPWNIEENDGTDDKYPPWPNDWEIEVNKIITKSRKL
nr:unnamed protein product [Callosobruchus chinensis]